MMKTLLTIPTLCFVILHFSACNSSYSLNEIEVNQQYVIKIPDFMLPTSTLNEDASLQYHNPVKELYVIVIDESMEEFKNIIIETDLWKGNDERDFFEIFYGFVLENEDNYFLTNIEKEKVKSEVINNMRVKLLKNTNSLNGIGIYYNIALFEGKNSYYQVLVWTLEDRKEKFEDLMNEIISSFSEV